MEYKNIGYIEASLPDDVIRMILEELSNHDLSYILMNPDKSKLRIEILQEVIRKDPVKDFKKLI